MNARDKAAPPVSSKGPAQSGEMPIEIAVDSARIPTLERVSATGILSGQPAPLTMPFAPGDIVGGKYQVIGLIGAGGVAFVVAALHLELGEMVALKFLRPESLAHEEVVERFATEARAAARIKSEYVCRVYDVGTMPDGAPYIVMEYLEGKDLSDMVREQGRIPVKAAVDYVLQTCEALASAHAAGIVHRDIKPENLFLARHSGSVETIKVLDFGISKTALKAASGGKRRFAKTMMPMGTPAYMSPEQIRACGTVDARADIWAVGCVLFELLTGACVFDAPTLMQLGAAILERDAIPLRKILPDAPAGLEAVILKCLQKDAANRYQNVAQLASDLYPYGSRRARISAERCSHILHSAGIGEAPLELSSIGPPPFDMSGPTTQPAPKTNRELDSASATASAAAVETESKPRRRLVPLALVGLAALAAAGFLLLRTGSPEPTAKEPPAAAVPVPPAATPVSGEVAKATLSGQTAQPNGPATGGVSGPAESENPAKNRVRRPRVAPPPSPPPRVRPAPPVRKSAHSAGDDEPDVGF